MNITDIKIRLTPDCRSHVKASLAFTVDHWLAVHDALIIEGEHGLFLAMPSRRCSDGVYRDIVHPLDSDSRAELSAICIQAYERVLRRRMVCGI